MTSKMLRMATAATTNDKNLEAVLFMPPRIEMLGESGLTALFMDDSRLAAGPQKKNQKRKIEGDLKKTWSVF